MRKIFKILGVGILIKAVLTGAGLIGYHIGYDRGYKKASEEYKTEVIEDSIERGKLRQANHNLETDVLEEQLKVLELMKKNVRYMRDNYDLKHENDLLKGVEPAKTKQIDIISYSQ